MNIFGKFQRRQGTARKDRSGLRQQGPATFRSIRGAGAILCMASLPFMAMVCNPFAYQDAKPDPWRVTTLAGGSAGFVNGTGANARFNTPAGLALSDDEQTLYIADRRNHCIRSLDTASGNVSTLAGNCGPANAGSADGTGAAALFTDPEHIAFNKGTLYVAGSKWIRQIDVKTARVSGLGFPRDSFDGTVISGIAIQPDGSRLYFLDQQKGRVRVVDLRSRTKELRTLVGTDTDDGDVRPQSGGPAGELPVDGVCFGTMYTAKATCLVGLFHRPRGMAISPTGEHLYLADDAANTHVVRRVYIPNGVVMSSGATLTPGEGTRVGLAQLDGVTYIADGNANRIKRMTLTTVMMEQDGIQIFAGDGVPESRDGTRLDSSFNRPAAIAANRKVDRIYVADMGSHRIRLIALP